MGNVGAVMVAAVIAAVVAAAEARADDAAATQASVEELRIKRRDCIEACSLDYKSCIQRHEAKNPGMCGGIAVRCRKACPPKPPKVRAVSAPPAAAPAPAAPPAAEQPALTDTRPIDQAPAAPSAGVREVEPAKAPTTAAERPVSPAADSPPVKRETRIDAAPAEVTAGQSVPPAQGAPVPATESVPAAAPVEEEAAPRRRTNLARTAWCLFSRCEEELEDLTCEEECSNAYHDCVSLGDKRKSLHCGSDRAHCRERCASAAGGGTAP